MPQITFLGATGTVTGSRFLVELKNKKILIDCGLFQGPKKIRKRNWEPFPVDPATINNVIFTHAHIDHIGYFPRLCKDGFTGTAHATHATAELSKILLRDSGHLHEEDARWANKRGFSKHSPAMPLFNVADAEESLQYFKPAHYGQDIPIHNGYRLKFKDAGHILGSSIVDIKTTDPKNRRKIVFCGDLGRPARAILRDPTQVYDVDYLVLESTYGNRLHKELNFYDDFIRVIKESAERGGVLIIPSFSVGRTQTLLYIIRQLEDERKIPSLPVYVDSPMGLKATTIYEKRVSSHNLKSRALTIAGKKIFRPKQLKTCESRRKSKAINEIKSNAIIISSSGMVTGGRIMHHMEHRLPDKNNTVLFVGYQAEGTRGRLIVEGRETVKIHGQEIPVKAHVENISGLSGHADYNEIMAWLMGFNKPPKKTFIVHGEPDASKSLADKIISRFNWDVTIPELGESYLLDI